MDKLSLLSRITTREKEVIKLLAQGFTTKQIGQRLNISSTTVITHRNNLRIKLSCKNCPELIYRATQLGLLY
jgi:DNA-binding CsgD family transcriptional regulator